jgi:hypothetical protein
MFCIAISYFLESPGPKRLIVKLTLALETVLAIAISIAILIFGAAIGMFIGFRSTAVALIPAVLLVIASTVLLVPLASGQDDSTLLIDLLAAFVVPQIGFFLAIYLKKRAIDRTGALMRGAQIVIGQEMAKSSLPQEIPSHMFLLLRRLEEQYPHSEPALIDPLNERALEPNSRQR